MNLEEYARQQQQQPQEQPQPQQKTRLQAEQESQQRAKEQAFDVYKKYQENIRKVSALSTEILKGLQSGENIAALFLKAVKAYTLCIDNPAEYKVIENTLQTVYGKALQDTATAELTADAIRNRLERLQKAHQQTDDNNDKALIEQAIKAHQKELESLQI